MAWSSTRRATAPCTPASPAPPSTNNGDTVAILCTVPTTNGGDDGLCEPDDLGQLIEDLDDGFDIDEEDAGDVILSVDRSEVSDNFDEGMDMDEAGEGSIVATVTQTEASRNGDEGYKASEADGGDNTATIDRSTFEDAGNDQIEVESEDGDGSGTVTVDLSRVTSTGAEGSGVKAVEDDGGAVEVTVSRSTLTGNGEWGVEAAGGSGFVDVDQVGSVRQRRRGSRARHLSFYPELGSARWHDHHMERVVRSPRSLHLVSMTSSVESCTVTHVATAPAGPTPPPQRHSPDPEPS